MSVFLTARAFAGTSISIGIGNIYILFACPGGAQVGFESMIGSAPPCLFCSAICRSKLSSQNPFDLRVFLTAGNTAWKISLVQIILPFPTFGGLLYDTLDGVMVFALLGEFPILIHGLSIINFYFLDGNFSRIAFVLRDIYLKVSSSKKVRPYTRILLENSMEEGAAASMGMGYDATG